MYSATYIQIIRLAPKLHSLQIFSKYSIHVFAKIGGEYFLNHVFVFMENLLLFYYSSCLDTIIMGVMNDIHQNT